MNHDKDECYSKNGFPPWVKQRYKGNINQMKTTRIVKKPGR